MMERSMDQKEKDINRSDVIKQLEGEREKRNQELMERMNKKMEYIVEMQQTRKMDEVEIEKKWLKYQDKIEKHRR